MKQLARVIALTAGVIMNAAASSATANNGVVPIGLHPKNPHYFQWHGQPTILITSAEHYGALLNLDFDYQAYLAQLAKDGLNHTRAFSGVYREVVGSFGITDNTLAPKANRFICPWQRSATPGYFDAGNKFDLDKWDESYFRRLRDFLRHADEHAIVVELTLFCPMYKDEMWKASPMHVANNINGIGEVDRESVYALKDNGLAEIQRRVTSKIVTEVNEFDNLYFEVCNEPYFGGVTMQWQHTIIDTIVATEKDLPKKHLISLNVANKSAKVVNPHPAVSILNFHYCVPPVAVAENYGLNKVIGENETGFRGKEDVLYRTEAWDFLLAGGGLYNNLDYSFTYKHPTGTCTDYTSPGGGSATLRQHLRILKEFLYGFDFISMSPDTSTIASATSRPAGADAKRLQLTSGKENLSCYCLSENGRAYAAYFHVPIPSKPKGKLRTIAGSTKTASVTLDLPTGRYAVEWVDTKSGETASSDSVETGDTSVTITSPEFIDDIALRILRR